MRRHLTMEKKRMLEGYIFILPWFIGGVLFFAGPMIQSIRLSFSRIIEHAGFVMEWAGLENYMRAFVWDIHFIPMFINVLRNILINMPLIIVFSLFIAILINRQLAMRGFFREVFFFPVLLGTGFVMQQLLGHQVDQQSMEVARGILLPHEVLLYLGPRVSTVIQTFMDRITMVLWKSGVQILLFLAGLQGISVSLYESARCDSATEWEMFWKITLPIISPVILLNMVYTVIDTFTDITNPIIHYMHHYAFRVTQFEYAAAIGWLYFLAVFIIVLLIFGIMQRFIYHAGDR